MNTLANCCSEETKGTGWLHDPSLTLPVHRNHWLEFFSYHGGCPRVLVSSVILFNGRDLGLRRRSSCLEIVPMS